MSARKFAAAVTFSPRFLQVLSEAKRIRDRFGAQLALIYAGERTDEIEERFSNARAELQLPGDLPIHFHHRDEPASAILEMLGAHGIDLIIAGALEKEITLMPFLGNVARRLVREAPCSVMLFTEPEREPQPLRRMVFMAEYTEHARGALREAIAFAEMEGCEHLYVVSVHTSFDEARAERGEEGARTLDEEERALEEFILSAGDTAIPIEARCIRGNTGYAALDFIRSIEADLLIAPVAPQRAAGDLPPQFAWIAETIPCNLWVIR